MDRQYEISFSITNHSLEALKIYIDNVQLDSKTDKYTWVGATGTHKIRIEQDKMYKSKWYWIVFPLLSILGSDLYIDGKTPYYYLYEAEIYIDSNMEITISLSDINKFKEKSKQDIVYEISVIYPEDVVVEEIRSELTASLKEKIKWFLANSVLITLLFGFAIFLFTILAIKELTIISIILLIIGIILTCGWAFIIYSLYKNTNINNIR